jgi:hypothetical protein
MSTVNTVGWHRKIAHQEIALRNSVSRKHNAMSYNQIKQGGEIILTAHSNITTKVDPSFGG